MFVLRGLLVVLLLQLIMLASNIHYGSAANDINQPSPLVPTPRTPRRLAYADNRQSAAPTSDSKKATPLKFPVG